ncbi:MAG: NCS2 family permease [Pirellulales bacterium]
MLDRFFGLAANRTTVRTELLAGLTTFLTMAYIIFVQPAVLSVDFKGQPTGLDAGAVLLATCVASAIATLIMALYANYPIAQAPGMGENFFFVSIIMALAAAKVADPWRVALGIVFLSGVAFLLLSLVGLRETIIDTMSPSMRNGIAAGIGLFIAFIGLKNGGLIESHPVTFVTLNAKIDSPDVAAKIGVFCCGLVVTAALHARRVRGSIVWGILAATALALALAKIHWPGAPVGLPEIKQNAIFAMDLKTAVSWLCLPYILIFLFMNLFDTVGTLIGVSEQAGFMKDNKLPRVRQALVSDAAATVVGAAMGTSTVTSFIESAAGVEQGGRTGLTGVVVAVLFLLALFFSPLVAMVGDYPPITAPALVIVGSMMMRNVTKIDWSNSGESLPAFLIAIGIPLFYSIADGLALGFIAYPIVKLLAGQGKDVKWLMYLLAAVLVAYFILVRARIA